MGYVGSLLERVSRARYRLKPGGPGALLPTPEEGGAAERAVEEPARRAAGVGRLKRALAHPPRRRAHAR